MEDEKKKLRVGWFTFSCCEDSTVIMIEVLNDHWQEWRKLIDFRHARVLQRKNVLDEMDVAFVEGAITSEEYVKKVKKIRDLAKVVVAVGACAVTGMPSGQRNNFDEKTKAEVQFLVERFKQLDRVMKVGEVIKVDAELPGCPMDPNQFIELVEKAFKDFKIK
ncbi:MAG: hypothetical protein ABIE68_02445 [bacterium]